MKAADEFAEAIAYIERRAPVAARRLAQRIMKRIRSLRRFPEAGGFVPEDEHRRYREMIEGNYRIIYRVESKAVVIMSIYHGARVLRSDELP